MHLYSFLALAGIALASPCRPDPYSSAGSDEDGNHWQPWSPSSTSTPVRGDHQVTSTATEGVQSSATYSHHSAASTASAQTWSVPKADPSAMVFPLHKRNNPDAAPAPVNTPSGWGDWNHGSSSTKSASGSQSTTSSKTASSTVSSKTSYLSSTTGSSSTTKASSTSPYASTTSQKSASTTLSTISTKTSTGSTSSSSNGSSTAASSSSTSVSISSTTSASSSSSSTVSSTSSSSGAFETTLLNPARNFFYTLDVAIGANTYELVIDTGSSDTWATGETPASFTPIPDEYLFISYADGSYALGPLGTDSVTLAGLTVPSQIISIANQTAGIVDPNRVGLIGLSFNQLTSEFPGTQPDIAAGADGPDPATVQHYSSIMNTIFNVDNLTPDLFSLALSRDPDEIANADQYGGVLVIGGEPDLADPTINVTTPVVSTSMTNFNVDYTISVDSVTYGDEVLDQGVSYLVDSGTTLILAPDASVDAYWAQFSPAPGTNGTVACDTAIPPFAVTIAGQDFPINPADLLRPSVTPGICIINIQSSAPIGDRNILGDVFLQNVLAVFDWGAEAIRFGGREYYSVPT